MTSPEFLDKWANDEEYHAPAPTNEVVLDGLSAETLERLRANPERVSDLALQLPQPADVLQSWADAWTAVKAS
jgi:hypothetical protein